MALAIYNEHARAACCAAVWDPTERQLVAAVIAGDKQTLKALFAELEKNSRNSWVTLSCSSGELDARQDLSGARKGFLKMHGTLEKVNAIGYVSALLHHKAHDPRLVYSEKTSKDPNPPPPTFYVVAQSDLPALFIERLQLALSWPLKTEWASELLRLGQEKLLIELLPVVHAKELGETVFFGSAVRVVKDDTAWQELLSAALREGTIKL